ncbi:mitochondrial inner membrane protein Mitofilin [Gautieria morchelliformis]|nr:mitochondrial inner membrane protein Mitofilin [Gautieria morchelliformis]
MQRLSVVSKRVQSRNNSQGVLKVTRLQYSRHLATESTSSASSSAASPSSPPKKRVRRIFVRTLLYSSALTLGVYGAGTFLAFQDERFHDFFIEFVPYGERIMEYAVHRGWQGHPVEPQAVLDAGRAAVEKQHAANGFVSTTQKWLDKAKEKANESSKSAREGAEKLKATSDVLKTKVVDNTKQVVTDAKNDLKHESTVLSEEIMQLTRRAEEALATNGVSLPIMHSELPKSTAVEFPGTSHKPTYTDRLPIGFEAPPGFVLPSTAEPSADTDVPVPPSPEVPVGPTPLPLVAPAVAEFSSSEPVLAQLASTIDNLAAFLKDNPSASMNSNAKGVLDTAQTDLIQLGERLQRVKEEEKVRLEAELEDQAREYSLKLLQLEMDAQDKMDLQEEDWRIYADNERQRTIQAYRAKLQQELQTQSEIINERLKEEVVAQGIELQRRWIREIKVRVEAERGGRLARLDELAADLKRLSRVTLDNSAYLDENLRMHALWSSIRALNAAVQESTVRRPFREELRILRHVAIAGGAREDPTLAVALETLEDSDIPDVGVEPFADLASWFTASVVPRVSTVALVPDQDAGLLSYLASSLLSSLRFQRRGLVEGDDVLSVLSRAEYYMNEKDLDSAARELNQLKGPAKVLLSDWLDAARKRLEVLQAIEIVQSQATLASLLLI